MEEMVEIEGAVGEDMEKVQMAVVMEAEVVDIIQEEEQVEEVVMEMAEVVLMFLDLVEVEGSIKMVAQEFVLYNIMHKELTNMNHIYIRGMCIAPPPRKPFQ